MNVHYLKYSPTGNITVLVTSPVPRALQPRVAARLLEADVVGGEQVGFVEPTAGAAARLQMMGGEFCGNATMSLGALLCRRAGLSDGDCATLPLEVSGLDAPIPCHVRREGEGWTGTVQMPLPTAVERAELDTDAGPLTVPLVRMPGIAHLLLPADAAPGEAELRRRLPQWNRAVGADALGALTWDADASAIDPLVYVPSAGTLVREHGCGSGSAAVGGWLALSGGRGLRVPIRQPGGTITVRADLIDGRLSALFITGIVTLLDEGDADVDPLPLQP